MNSLDFLKKLEIELKISKNSQHTIRNYLSANQKPLNFDKKEQKNYIGGSTFLEMFKAFELGKKIFLYNSIPEGMLKDEIIGFGVIPINRNLETINE